MILSDQGPGQRSTQINFSIKQTGASDQYFDPTEWLALLPLWPAIQIIYATNSDGKKASIVSASSIDSASADIWASVSNRYPHLVQD